MTEPERAYLAGLIDGEGCIMLTRGFDKRHGGERFQAIVTVTNSNRAMIDWLEERFPDVPSARLNYRSRHGHGGTLWKPTWDWRPTNRKAIPVLEEALPYLVCKGEQARIVLEVAAKSHTPGRLGYSESHRAFLRESHGRMRELNRRGVPV